MDTVADTTRQDNIHRTHTKTSQCTNRYSAILYYSERVKFTFIRRPFGRAIVLEQRNAYCRFTVFFSLLAFVRGLLWVISSEGEN
jgi:hypothetical protein